MALPFVLLLAAIALAPLLFPNWWQKHYPKVAFGLGAITLGYYLLGLHASHRVLEVGRDYLGFIALIGSLFIVASGIHITVKGEATPFENVLFLLTGAVVANLLGTTGASMLLIRPWIRMNKYRITGHHIVFFIFVVSNVGGCLTPIGDPPLFLGYLNGIPFWWVARNCWAIWLVGVGFLLGAFYCVDYRNFLRAPKVVRETLAEPPDVFQFQGLWNLCFLALILAAVFVKEPKYLREFLMIAAAIGSYYTTAKAIHESNEFNLHPLKEVVVLFAGIFATMIPALDWLEANAGRMGGASPAFFYWSSGTLSGVLDNAPTYLSFLSAAFGMLVNPELVAQVQNWVHHGAGPALGDPLQVQQTILTLQRLHGPNLASAGLTTEQIETAVVLSQLTLNKFIVAISIGAVFFGANTYIGNGPNFMVKAIADHRKVHCPTFLGYVFKFTLPYMFPMLLLVWFIFFRSR